MLSRSRLMSCSAPFAPRQMRVISGATRFLMASKLVGPVLPNIGPTTFLTQFAGVKLVLFRFATASASCVIWPMPVLSALFVFATVPLDASRAIAKREVHVAELNVGSYWVAIAMRCAHIGFPSAKLDGGAVSPLTIFLMMLTSR